MRYAPMVSQFDHRSVRMMLVAGGAAGLLLGCSGNAVSGTVGTLELTVQDGFYTEIDWQGSPYLVIVLADFPDACETLRTLWPDVDINFGILQMWLTDFEIGDYPVYGFDHQDEAGPIHALSWYTHFINYTEVVNTDGVAGVVQLSDYSQEKDFASGNMDIVFSGNGNRLQGSFAVSACDLDWEAIVSELIN